MSKYKIVTKKYVITIFTKMRDLTLILYKQQNDLKN